MVNSTREDIFGQINNVKNVSEIDELRLISLKSKFDIDKFSSPLTVNLTNTSSVKSSDPEKGLNIDVAFNFNGCKKKQIVISIEAVFRVSYKLTDKSSQLSKEDYQVFADVNAVYNVWPYWRELIQCMCTRMSLPPCTIPFLNAEELIQPKLLKKDKGQKRKISQKK